MITRPVEFCLLLLCCGLFLVGAVRFGAGASRSVGARDSVRWCVAVLHCVLGVVALVYLARVDLPERIGPPFGGVIAAAAFALPLWLALVGFCARRCCRGHAVGRGHWSFGTSKTQKLSGTEKHGGGCCGER